jgi:heme exporter protein D
MGIFEWLHFVFMFISYLLLIFVVDIKKKTVSVEVNFQKNRKERINARASKKYSTGPSQHHIDSLHDVILIRIVGDVLGRDFQHCGNSLAVISHDVANIISNLRSL